MQREDDGWGAGEARDCGGPKQTGQQLRTRWTEHGQWEVAGGRPYIKISREAPLRAEQDLPGRRWLESGMRSSRLHHRTSSSALPPSTHPSGAMMSPCRTSSRPSRAYGHEAQVTCVRGPGNL